MLPSEPSCAISLNIRKTNSLNVPEIRVSGRIKRVGNSLAIFVPAASARQAGLRAGDPVDAVIRTEIPAPLGLASDVPYQPFDRRDLWRDRV